MAYPFQQNPIMGQLPMFGGYTAQQAQGLPQFQMPQMPQGPRMSPFALGAQLGQQHPLGAALGMGIGYGLKHFGAFK